MESRPDQKMPLSEARKLLGEAGVGLSDAEIEYLRDWAERFADLFFDWWLRNRKSWPQLAETAEK
jgi:hypothetical protein